LQPVASTSPVTVPGGLIIAAVRSMASLTKPVAVQLAACATGANTAPRHVELKSPPIATAIPIRPYRGFAVKLHPSDDKGMTWQ
jgi:hypothetical protein